jgi:uncharacterized membrane protein YbhN (UPF0104 family)
MRVVEPGMSTTQSDADDAKPGRSAILDRILGAREGPQNPWLLVVALLVFVGFTVLAVRALPHIDKPIRWELIAVAALVCVPVIVGLNALEFRLMAHFAQHHPPMLEIMQITVLGSAANLLPMPGAVMVRLANLRKAGVRVTRGLNLTAIVGLAWLGTAGVLGGVVQLWSHTAFALAALAMGATLLAIGAVMLTRALQPGTRVAGALELFAIECAFVLMHALRLYLIAAALRFDVSYAQTTTLAIAAVAAAAIGFLPSGLGAREGIAALLAPIVGFPAAVGLVITAVDRFVSLAVLSVFAGILAAMTRRGHRTPSP